MIEEGMTPEEVSQVTREQILYGIAFGPWAIHWADAQEKRGTSFSGLDVSQLAPPPPDWARAWALRVEIVLRKANSQATLEGLWGLAMAYDYRCGSLAFGMDVGLQAAGHGVSWHDSCDAGRKEIEIPYVEFY